MAQLATFSSTLGGAALALRASTPRQARPASIQAAAPQKFVTKKLKPGTAPKPPPPPPKKTGTISLKPAGTKAGTRTVAGTRTTGTGTRKVAIEVFSNEKTFRPQQSVAKPAPKILAKVEQLRLLSKAEQAGLLSLLEKQGLTLSAIESSGLLSTAEKFGLISAAADRGTPGALYGLATVLLAAGPALVYFVPDSDPVLVALQVVGALVAVAGGSAAYGGATLLSTLQK